MVVTEVSSDRAMNGDIIKLRVQVPVTLGDKIVIPVGTPAFGLVETSTPGKRLLKVGKISGRMTHLALPNGSIKLRGEFRRGGVVSSADNMLKTSLLPWESIFSPGNAGKLKAGEIVNAMVDGNYVVTGAGDVLSGRRVGDGNDASGCGATENGDVSPSQRSN